MFNNKKDKNYISARESRQISRQNRKITNAIEKKRNRKNVSEQEYVTTMRDHNNVVEFDNLHTYFFTDIGTVKAVDGVSFDIPQGKTVGVVGESGCGKSVTSLSLMQLVQRPTGQTVKGAMRLNMGDKVYDIAKMPISAMEKIRGNVISMIFQEPMTSLNPVFRVGDQLNEVIHLHYPDMSEEQVKARSIEMIDTVGIANSAGVYQMYPHELSGGMRQRIMIAMALACNPRLIIADEPTTALDVTIQIQVLELMKELRNEFGTAMIMITHDLGVVGEVCDRVAVMYAGEIIEDGSIGQIFDHPLHPYTVGLFRCIPDIEEPTSVIHPIRGLMPDPLAVAQGCCFEPRCPEAMPRCAITRPGCVMADGHRVFCHLYADGKRAFAHGKEVAANV